MYNTRCVTISLDLTHVLCSPRDDDIGILLSLRVEEANITDSQNTRTRARAHTHTRTHVRTHAHTHTHVTSQSHAHHATSKTGTHDRLQYSAE